MSDTKDALLSQLAQKAALSPEEEEKIRGSLLETIQRDPFIQSELKREGTHAEALEASLLAFQQLAFDHQACQKCQSLSRCPKDGIKGYAKSLRYHPYSGSYDLVSGFCPKMQKVQDVFAHIIFSDVPEMDLYQAGVNLQAVSQGAKIKTKEGSFLSTLSLALSKIRSFKPEGLNRGLFVSSADRNGEVLSEALAYYFALNKKSVAVLSAASLDDKANKDPSISQQGKASVQAASPAQVLIILGLGQEYKSIAFRDEALIPLLRERNSQGKLTFFSCLMPLDDYLDCYGKEKSQNIGILSGLFSNLADEAPIKDIPYF
jgi:hypothetical protein